MGAEERCPACGTWLPSSMRRPPVTTGRRLRIRLMSKGLATKPSPLTDFALAA